GAAADVEEVGRLAAAALDHVQRRHDQAGAVADDAHVAVQLDVGQAPAGRLLLQRMLSLFTLVRGDVLLAEQRVVVNLHLAVQGHDAPVLEQGEGVDFHQHGVLGPQNAVHGVQNGSQLLQHVRRHAGLQGDVADVVVAQAQPGVNPVLDDFFRRLFCDFLDVHAAFGGEDDDVGLAVAVGGDAEVELLLDGGGFFHEHLLDFEAFQVHAQNLPGLFVGAVRAVGQLDAAGLAPAADGHLGFDHHAPADFSGDVPDFLGRGGQPAARHGNARRGEDGFGLTFNEIQLCGTPSPSRVSVLPNGNYTQGRRKRKPRRPRGLQRNSKKTTTAASAIQIHVAYDGAPARPRRTWSRMCSFSSRLARFQWLTA